MLSLVVLACLTGAPDQCAEREHGRFDSQPTCQAAGRELARSAAGETLQAWTCREAATPGFWISEVAPGVFVHKGQHAEPGPGNAADTANIGYIIGENAVAVIDAGGSDAVAQALLDDIRRRTDLPVRYLILTHMHPDHVLGAGVFAGAGAEVIAHPQLPTALGARHGFYIEAYTRDVGPGWQASTTLPPITAAADHLDLGDRVLTLRQHATGHTTNDLSVFDATTETWFLGDLIFLDHMPSIDASLLGWIAVLETAEHQGAARVVPGHGPVSVPWPEAAEPTLTYLTELVATLRASIAAGAELLDAVTLIGDDSPPGWLLSETFHPRNVTSAFRELEWE